MLSINSTTNWGPNVQVLEPMEDFCLYSNHHELARLQPILLSSVFCGYCKVSHLSVTSTYDVKFCLTTVLKQKHQISTETFLCIFFRHFCQNCRKLTNTISNGSLATKTTKYSCVSRLGSSSQSLRKVFTIFFTAQKLCMFKAMDQWWPSLSFIFSYRNRRCISYNPFELFEFTSLSGEKNLLF